MYKYIFLLFSLLVDILKQIDIPSVFVSEETADSLKKDYAYDKGWVADQDLISMSINIKANSRRRHPNWRALSILSKNPVQINLSALF